MTQNKQTSSKMNVVIGLYHRIPPSISAVIGQWAGILRDSQRLDEVIEILTQVQSHVIHCRFNQENVRIWNIIHQIESNVKSLPVSITTFGTRGHKYVANWMLVGSNMHDPKHSIDEHNRPTLITNRIMCEANKKYYLIDNNKKKHYMCNLSIAGWDGSKPGEVFDHCSLPSPGWFAGEIAFLSELKRIVLSGNF